MEEEEEEKGRWKEKEEERSIDLIIRHKIEFNRISENKIKQNPRL